MNSRNVSLKNRAWPVYFTWCIVGIIFVILMHNFFIWFLNNCAAKTSSIKSEIVSCYCRAWRCKNLLHDSKRWTKVKLVLDVTENASKNNLKDYVCVKPYPIDYSAIKRLKRVRETFVLGRGMTSERDKELNLINV